MSGMFNVNLNGQKISIKVGEKLEEIKKKLGNPDNTIFADVDVNNDGKLDATELEKLKTSLVDNDYEIDMAADGKTPKVAYNQAIQNLKGSYDTEKLIMICIIAYFGIAIFAMFLKEQWQFWILDLWIYAGKVLLSWEQV